jgi:CubicO group peptidase (beta-lactamase class C family)
VRGKVYDCTFRSYSRDIGYGFQWWAFTDRPHEFTGQGVFGQFLHVFPDRDLVIVQFSSWPSQWSEAQECEAYAVHDAISLALR